MKHTMTDIWALLQASYRGKTWLGVGLTWLSFQTLILLLSVPWLFDLQSRSMQSLLLGLPLLAWAMGTLLCLGYSLRLAYGIGAVFWGLALGGLSYLVGLPWSGTLSLVALVGLGAWMLESTVVTLSLENRLSWPWTPLDSQALYARHQQGLAQAHEKTSTAVQAKTAQAADALAAFETPEVDATDLAHLGLKGHENWKTIKSHYEARVTALNLQRRQRKIRGPEFQKRRRALELSYQKIRWTLKKHHAAQRAKQAARKAGQTRLNPERMAQKLQQVQDRLRQTRRDLKEVRYDLLGKQLRDIWESLGAIPGNIGHFFAYVLTYDIRDFWFDGADDENSDDWDTEADVVDWEQMIAAQGLGTSEGELASVGGLGANWLQEQAEREAAEASAAAKAAGEWDAEEQARFDAAYQGIRQSFRDAHDADDFEADDEDGELDQAGCFSCAFVVAVAGIAVTQRLWVGLLILFLMWGFPNILAFAHHLFRYVGPVDLSAVRRRSLEAVRKKRARLKLQRDRLQQTQRELQRQLRSLKPSTTREMTQHWYLLLGGELVLLLLLYLLPYIRV